MWRTYGIILIQESVQVSLDGGFLESASKKVVPVDAVAPSGAT